MPMDFFERQEFARAKSRKIVLLFLLTLPCLVAAVYVVSLGVYAVAWGFFAFWRSVSFEIQPGQSGAKELEAGDARLHLVALSDCTFNSLESPLDDLAQAAGSLENAFLGACTQTVAADGRIRPREAELLRAIADSPDCPMPPLSHNAVAHLLLTPITSKDCLSDIRCTPYGKFTHMRKFSVWCGGGLGALLR